MSVPDSNTFPRNAADIKKEAGDWLERKDRSGWSEADESEFDAWLAQSAAHLIAYHRVAEAWKQAERLVALRGPSEVWRNDQRGTKPFLMRVAAAIAITAIFVVGGGAYFLTRSSGQTFETSLGGHKVVALSDGSHIELNTDTFVHVDLSSGQRMASLEKGEAYFEIAHDASRPFTVKVANHRITVLGTRFRVLDAPGKVEVALLDGRVWFDTEAKDKHPQSALLSPGQVLVATAQGMSVTSQSARSLESDLSWRNGLLVFRHISLLDAANEYNRYNARKIVIANASVGKLTISGILPTKDLNAFAHMARTFFDIRVSENDREIVLSR
jgi:transmembrane sensor